MDILFPGMCMQKMFRLTLLLCISLILNAGWLGVSPVYFSKNSL